MISLQQQLQLEIDEEIAQLELLRSIEDDKENEPFNIAFLSISLQELRDRVKALEVELAQAKRYALLLCLAVLLPLKRALSLQSHLWTCRWQLLLQAKFPNR